MGLDRIGKEHGREHQVYRCWLQRMTGRHLQRQFLFSLVPQFIQRSTIANGPDVKSPVSSRCFPGAPDAFLFPVAGVFDRVTANVRLGPHAFPFLRVVAPSDDKRTDAVVSLARDDAVSKLQHQIHRKTTLVEEHVHVETCPLTGWKIGFAHGSTNTTGGG